MCTFSAACCCKCEFSLDVADASVFSSNTPSSVLAAPPTVAPVFLAISLAFTVIFFVTFAGISFRHLMGKAGNVWENPLLQRASAWIGISSFLVGMWYIMGHRCFALKICTLQAWRLFSSFAYILERRQVISIRASKAKEQMVHNSLQTQVMDSRVSSR